MPTVTRSWRPPDPNTRLWAHGAYIRIDADRAEVAFVVTDAWQGHGHRNDPARELAAVAKEHGIVVFKAEVLPYNHRMIEVFRDSGFPSAATARRRRDRG